MKAATIALAVEFNEGVPQLKETLSDSREISILESSLHLGEKDPLRRVHEFRQKQLREDEEFSDYVEKLLSKPFLKAEIQEHGVQWLKSRIRIEQFQKDEDEAAEIIADYAFEIFSHQPALRDFLLSGPKAQVRIRVFVLSEIEKNLRSA